MAGTVASLSFSQQFDRTTAKFLAGGKLYFYQANTSTPQSAYKDTALTLSHPNPITLDAAGRIPMFYLADGSIRVRLQSKSGVVQFDEHNLLVIGPSSGGGGGGTSVDPTAIFQTGDVIWVDQSGTRAGWVRDNGRTIGSATSGSSERANSDCQPLYLFLWATYSDTICPVLTGRGASAAADWAANKQITLPDKRGRFPVGLDTMGNSALGFFVGVPFLSGDGATAGSKGGEFTHQLVLAETPYKTIEGTTSAPNDLMTVPTVGGPGAATQQNGDGASYAALTAPSGTNDIAGIYNIHDHDFTASNGGGDGVHNNTPVFCTGTYFRKL